MNYAAIAKKAGAAVGESFGVYNSTYPGSAIPKVNREWNTTEPVENMQLANMVQTQAFIWIPIILAAIVITATCALCTVNQGKDRDSLLYAKFLSKVESR